MTFRASLLAIAASLVGCGGLEPTNGSGEGALVVVNPCEFSAMGRLATGDHFNGATVVDSTGTLASFRWHHMTPPGGGMPHRFTADRIDDVTCRLNGSRIADVMGAGKWDGAPGYLFTLHGQDYDRGELDYYRFLVFDPGGALVHLADGDVVSGPGVRIVL